MFYDCMNNVVQTQGWNFYLADECWLIFMFMITNIILRWWAIGVVSWDIHDGPTFNRIKVTPCLNPTTNIRPSLYHYPFLALFLPPQNLSCFNLRPISTNSLTWFQISADSDIYRQYRIGFWGIWYILTL